MSPRERVSGVLRAVGIDPVGTSPTLRWLLAAWIFMSAPLVDGREGLSLTRFLSIYFASLVGYSVKEQKGVITLNALWLALASAAIAFGKSTFTFLLRRMAYRGEGKQIDINTRSEIIERRVTRGDGEAFEPT